MGGSISLDRRLLEWEWHDEPLTGWLWVNLLLMANYKDTKWHGTEVKRGQLMTSLENLCAQTGLTTWQVRARLTKLEQCECITKKTTNKNTLITICKYDSYQVDFGKDHKQTTNKPQTNHKQTTTSNKDNNIIIKKEKKENIKEKFRERILGMKGYSQNHLETFAEYYGQQSSQDPSKLLYETLPQFDLEYALQQWQPPKEQKEHRTRAKTNTKAFEAYDQRTSEQRKADEKAEWESKRKEIEGWIATAKQVPNGRAAKQVKAWSENGTLDKYGLTI